MSGVCDDRGLPRVLLLSPLLRHKLPVSVHGGPPFAVSARQVELLCARVGHLTRLCERMRSALQTGARLELTDSEAMLLVAEIRRGAPSDEEPLDGLTEGLLAHIEKLDLDTHDEFE